MKRPTDRDDPPFSVAPPAADDPIYAALRNLEAPPAPPMPILGDRRPKRKWVGPVALAAALLVGISIGSSLRSTGTWSPRGDGEPVPPRLELEVERDGAVVPVVGPVRLGEQLRFRVGSSDAMPITLSLDGPQGHEVVATLAAGPELTDARVDGLYLRYRMNTPGKFVFAASSDPETCGLGCVRRAVEVLATESPPEPSLNENTADEK